MDELDRVLVNRLQEGIGRVLEEIEQETGYRALDLPKRREYYLRLKLDAGAAR